MKDFLLLVDTVGKQEAFDWGWGWVAVRSVAWSPFDEFIFATTGNVCLFLYISTLPRRTLGSAVSQPIH